MVSCDLVTWLQRLLQAPTFRERRREMMSEKRRNKREKYRHINHKGFLYSKPWKSTAASNKVFLVQSALGYQALCCRRQSWVYQMETR